MAKNTMGGGTRMYGSGASSYKSNDPATHGCDLGQVSSYGSNANVTTDRLRKGGDMKWKGKRSSYRGTK